MYVSERNVIHVGTEFLILIRNEYAGLSLKDYSWQLMLNLRQQSCCGWQRFRRLDGSVFLFYLWNNSGFLFSHQPISEDHRIQRTVSDVLLWLSFIPENVQTTSRANRWHNKRWTQPKHLTWLSCPLGFLSLHDKETGQLHTDRAWLPNSTNQL